MCQSRELLRWIIVLTLQFQNLQEMGQSPASCGFPIIVIVYMGRLLSSRSRRSNVLTHQLKSQHHVQLQLL